MEEKNIYLSDLGDEDLVAIQSSFYKSIKLKQAFTSLSASVRYTLGAISHQYGTFDLGLSIFDKSYGRGSFCLHQEFMNDGFNYKFIKLGCPGWQTSLLKLSVKPCLSLMESETQEKILIPHYDFSGINFCDEDMLSFEEDKFCTGKIFKDIFQKSFEDGKFYNDCESFLSQHVPEFKPTNEIFKYGISLRFLRIETARWQPAILRVRFAFETEINGDREIENITNPSPLDEIRNAIAIRNDSRTDKGFTPLVQ